MSAELLLHWQLDHVAPDGVLLDSSPGARNGHVEGQPSAQPDERFGSCLALNGQSDALVAAAAPDLRLRTYTITVWVQLPAPDPAPTRTGPRVLAAQTGGPSMAISPAGAFVHEVVIGTGKRHSLNAPVSSLDWSAWHHLAITSDESTARTFIDGSQIALVIRTKPAESQGDLVIGADLLRTTHTAGRFAHLRVYTDALTEEELRRDMADDQAALSAFVRTHPLEIELTNVNGQPVLYIDDGPATQQLTLRLTNSSRQDVELRPGTGPVSAQSHHLALLFRPGTLAAAAAPATPAPGWTIQRDPAGTTLYLLHSDTLTIGRGHWLEVPITGLNADGAGGSRGTRVEAEFGQLGYTGEQEELTGSRLLFLDVVNHRGRPDIPLDVSFVGGDRVLSDGHSASTLRIRLSTVSRDTGLALRGRATARDAASAFVVSFESQQDDESREWALTTSANAGSVHLAMPAIGAGSDWVITPDDLEQRRRWILTPPTDTEIPADGHIELALSDIKALELPGHAPIVIEYQNIPGYQDGFVSLAAERTPLLFSASTVGIGQAAGPTRLTISADSGHLQLRREPNSPGTGAQQYLELFQDDDKAPHQTTFPRIGFTHFGRFAHSIEARPEGIAFKGGPMTFDLKGDPVTSDALLDVYAGRLVLARSQPGGVKLHLFQQPLTTPALTVGAESAHVQLRRESKVARTGTQLYLELYQDQPPEGQVTFPSIRFHQENKFWHRIEGRPEGFAFKDGDLESDVLVDVYAARAVLGTSQPGTIDQTTAPAGLTINADSGHLQLRRESTASGKQVYLELFQNNTPDGQITLPSIRFNHSNKFWHRIEGRPEGFAFTDGNLNSDSLTNITANTATLSSLRIGAITIGENELRILQLLASGQLKFDLLNASHNQYIYVTDYGASGDRWNVYSWRPGDRITQGIWQLIDPRS